ncbi:MAG TPA: DNA repair protein RecO [Desulfobulbaceae bacterium]|nr:MAG: DNA repair protein RecO [Deltaproteobacteria bacterium RIFOXYD12_FULL_53_23]HCC55426.1 DNA repair protein RecO [Desulfobulbaceae bacterium]
MSLQKSLAIVLQVKDHGDSDKIVTLYTLEHGKIALIAKGAKRSKKRFVNKLELFSLLAIYFAPSRHSSLMRLDQADLLNPFPRLRENYELYIAASLFCELVLHWTREHDSDEELFRLLVWALECLVMEGVVVKRAVIFFHIKMLDILGYRPDLTGCLDCRILGVSGFLYRFSPLRNGLVCSRCEPQAMANSQLLSIQTIQLLRRAQDIEQGKLERLHFSLAATGEAIALLKRYDNHLLQREVQSWNFLG